MNLLFKAVEDSLEFSKGDRILLIPRWEGGELLGMVYRNLDTKYNLTYSPEMSKLASSVDLLQQLLDTKTRINVD